MPSTAKTGNPTEATRGKGYERALAALGNAIDKRLDIERQEFELLSQVTGIAAPEVSSRLSAATLGELTAWTDLINGNLFASIPSCASQESDGSRTPKTDGCSSVLAT